jgi:hypothetical protein
VLMRGIHRALVRLLEIERRLEPYFRQSMNRHLREPSAALIQLLINRKRPNEGLRIAEERISPDEEKSLDEIIRLMADQMHGHFQPGEYERGGNAARALSRDLRVLVNGRSVAFLEGLETPVGESDYVTLHFSGIRGFPGG